MVNKRIEWLDLLKVLAMILVIIGHSSYTTIMTKYGGVEHTPTSGFNPVFSGINKFVAFIYTFHMPLFMAISGALFSLGFNKIESIKDLAKAKGIRLLIPFIVTATVVAIPIKLLSGYWDNSAHAVSDILVGQYLLFGNSHLWYVVSLFWIFLTFYLIYPLFNKSPIMVWGTLIILSISSVLITPGFGLNGWSKHLLYFSIGFFSLDWCMNFNPKWKLFGGSLIVQVFSYTYLYSGIHNNYARAVMAIIFALWGMVNMLMFCKLLFAQNTRLVNSRFYKWLNKYSYELYLYSDPINYVMIFIFFGISTFDVFVNPGDSIIFFLTRIIANFLFAAIVIYLFNAMGRLYRNNKNENNIA
ncbi:MAG: acyltransferase [Muribaculaceae bacterium]|nr:acyltransferase [Muribaculaceae bacterium]